MKDMVNFEIRKRNQGRAGNTYQVISPQGNIIRECSIGDLYNVMNYLTEHYNNIPSGCIGVTFTIG